MSKSFDSRLEEAIARLPLMGWFDSRRSGDPVGYVHKVLWVSAASSLAYLLGTDAWRGGATYCLLYVAFWKVPGFIVAWRNWKRDPAKHAGPWKDRRPHKSGVHFGFATDAGLDVLTAIATTAAVALK